MDYPFEVLRKALLETPAESGGIFLFRRQALAILKEGDRLRSIEGAWLLLPSAEKRAAEAEYARLVPQRRIERRLGEMQALKGSLGGKC